MYKVLIILELLFAFTASARLSFPLTYDTNPEIAHNKTEENVNYTLPNTAIPKYYKLQFKPYLEEGSSKRFTFDGLAEIKIDIIQDVKNIVLHSRELVFDRNNVNLKRDASDIQEFSVKFDTNKDFVNITSLADNFVKGSYVLKINYVGQLNDDMRGFYRSSYIDENGVKKWLATTHLEPVGARRAFPCFDEPRYKATFDVTIIHEKRFLALSNTKVKNIASSNDFTTSSFYTTPPMSTYLLAFLVSDFSRISNKNLNFSVFARPNAIQYGNLSFNVGEKLLHELEEFTGIEFKINKLDQAAIPDFAAGAMENWGLVLYREKSLLYDEKVLTTSEKQNIVETIAHEFAHQWFGNLVSPIRWKYLWLNEGFANFFQSYITEKIAPEWFPIYQSVVKNIQNIAFDFDSGSTTHPLNQDVESPKEINAIFDSISYQKGKQTVIVINDFSTKLRVSKAFKTPKRDDNNLQSSEPPHIINFRYNTSGAVIRMMQHFLTEPIFRKGLQNYLGKKSFSVADSDDLLASIQEIINNEKLNIDLKTVMDKWINNKGYPVVYVTRQYNDNNSTVEIRQERFFKYNASKEERDNKYQWYIPINYATQAKPDFERTTPQQWLKTAAMNISVDADPKDWLIFNKQQTGFYRVNYDNANWKLIAEHLNSKNPSKIHVLNRAQLLDDALAFVKQDQLNLNILLQLTRYLKFERDHIALYPGFKAYSWLKSKLINTEYYSAFKEYVFGNTKDLLDSVGFEESLNDQHLTKLTRITAINWVCLVGNRECLNKMQGKLLAWLDDSEKNFVSPDLKQITLCYGLQTANVVTWKRVLDKSLKIDDPDVKKQFLAALGCSNNNDILRYYFNFIVNDTTPFNNTYLALSTSLNNALDNTEIGVDVALDFVIQRFITLLRKIKNEDQITSLFNSIGNKITTTRQLLKLKETKNMDIPESITGRGIELAENNIRWLKDNEKTLRSWVRDVSTNANANGARSISACLSLILFTLLATHFSIE